jgi:hypothetical protein
VAGQKFFVLEVTGISNHRQILSVQHIACLCRHGRELAAITAFIGHLMRNDQMMFGIDGRLDVVAHDIRRAIYTTNAIESLNSVIRKAIKKRKLFPTDDAAKKVVYLAIQQASKKWTLPIRDWKAALNRFMIEFEDRLTDYV